MVRYQLSMDGMPPDEVTPSSPVAPSVMLLDTVDGQTLRFHLRLRTFGAEADARPSEEVQLRFSVDRTPPAPPVLDGAVAGASFPEPRSVRLLAEEGEIHYSLAAATAEGREPADDGPPLRYGGELRLEAPEGQSRSYRLTAFTVDRAGNRSRTAPVWLLSVDRQSVYVSPDGDDLADGSRSRPLRSLERAVTLAREGGRTRILLAEGPYALEREVCLEGELRLEGGFEPQTWERPRFEGRSVLEGTGRHPPGSPLLRVRSGSAVLDGLELRDAGRLTGPLLEVEGGRLEAAGLKLVLAAEPGGRLRQARGARLQGGSLLLQGCELQADGVRQGSLLEVTGGTAASWTAASPGRARPTSSSPSA